MSSHHFVKEGQEPALLIIDPIGFWLAEPLLEWAPLVLVTQESLNEVLDWGIKVDAVLVRPASAELLIDRLSAQAPVKFLTSRAEDNLETALHFLIALKHQAVSILVNNPVAQMVKLNPFIGRLTISLLSESLRWSAISSGSYKKWLPEGSRLQFCGLSKESSFAGLQKSGDFLEVIADGSVEVADSGPFWVGELI